MHVLQGLLGGWVGVVGGEGGRELLGSTGIVSSQATRRSGSARRSPAVRNLMAKVIGGGGGNFRAARIFLVNISLAGIFFSVCKNFLLFFLGYTQCVNLTVTQFSLA